MSHVTFSPNFRNRPFEQISRSFLDDPALPFAKVLPRETIELVFRKYDNLRGGVYYNTAIVLWAFLAQVLSDGKSRSCSAAVARIVAYCVASGIKPPSESTGDYCNARAELSLKALNELAVLVAKNTESIAPNDWLWKNKHHAKLVDGFTATMPDTYENQRRFPQHNQKPGCAYSTNTAPSCVSASFCRSPRRWFSTRRTPNTREKRPANPLCCAKCSTRSTPTISRSSTGIVVRT